MLLMNYKGTALHPFPCPLCIGERAGLDKGGKSIQKKVILLGPEADFVIASYHELVPAKMEIQRLLGVYREDPNAIFTFMKDPQEE